VSKNKYAKHNSSPLQCSIFNRVHQVAPTAQEWTTVTLGGVPSSLVLVTVYKTSLLRYYGVAVCRRSNGVAFINEVTSSQLVVGWWLSLAGHTTSVCNQPPRHTQPCSLSGTGNE